MQKLLLAAAVAALLEGCASPGAAPPANTNGGTVLAIEHSFTGITYKTFTAPADDVHWAARKALGRMQMTVTEETATPDGWKIAAAATQREIQIDLEHVTAGATRMRVVADPGGFFKDVATATEIVVQTADALEEMKTAQQAPPPPQAKAKPRVKSKSKPKPPAPDKPKDTI